MHKRNNPNLTAERLREVLFYDPNSGVFTRIKGVKGQRAGAICGWTDRQGYRVVCIDGNDWRAHRLAWLYITGKWPKGEIDHINRKKDDNKFVNLRESTHLQNSFNNPMRRNNTTGFTGVSPDHYTSRYIARYGFYGRSIHLGTFDTAEEASEAYQKAIAYRGEFAPKKVI
jgi:hypothetical protein